MIRYQDYAISFAENKRDGVTVCIISRVTHEKSGKMMRDPLDSEGGVAYCSEKDGYDRVKGMRLALQRALNSSDLFSAADRKAIWAEWVKRYVRENKPKPLQSPESDFRFMPVDWRSRYGVSEYMVK